jgi:LmbE family N-acetylglucosaminyl deacetylase
MKTVIAVAPHPDDETYGCGGTLLRHRELGDAVHWLIVTHMSKETGFSAERIKKREEEIERVKDMYGFTSVQQLNFPPARLEQIPLQELVSAIGKVFHDIAPQEVYLPYRGDVHTDHQVVFDAVNACTKWFRFKSVKKVLAYEALSETDFNLNPNISAFTPNNYTNIDTFLEKKISIAKMYASESGEFPFPRSEKAIRALANYRGSLAGFNAAEAFIVLREICD